MSTLIQVPMIQMLGLCFKFRDLLGQKFRSKLQDFANWWRKGRPGLTFYATNTDFHLFEICQNEKFEQISVDEVRLAKIIVNFDDSVFMSSMKWTKVYWNFYDRILTNHSKFRDLFSNHLVFDDEKLGKWIVTNSILHILRPEWVEIREINSHRKIFCEVISLMHN